MRKIFIASLGALFLIATAAPSYAQTPRKVPRGGAGSGEAGYELGCAFMWIMGYPACRELPNFPEHLKEKERTTG
jgi:hypothetical protein